MCGIFLNLVQLLWSRIYYCVMLAALHFEWNTGGHEQASNEHNQKNGPVNGETSCTIFHEQLNHGKASKIFVTE